MNTDTTCVLLTCEHATNHVPREYRHLFRSASAVLASHRGWDPGAREMADALCRESGARLISGRVSRLLVELNRSPGHRELWSEFTGSLSAAEKSAILATHYQPYRALVHHRIGRHLVAGETVLHFSVHSFTPVFEGRIRDCDVGLLFDPSRPLECRSARELRAWLGLAIPGIRVRMNQPYHGTDDGCTTWLRQRFPADRYSGIEIEFNQALLGDRSGSWEDLKQCIGFYLSCYENFGHGITIGQGAGAIPVESPARNRFNALVGRSR